MRQALGSKVDVSKITAVANQLHKSISQNDDLKLDIGGTGRYDDRVNINVDPESSAKIKLLFKITAGAKLPFRDESVEDAIAQSAPFAAAPYPTEIPRILEPFKSYTAWASKGFLEEGFEKFKDHPDLIEHSLIQEDVDWRPGAPGLMHKLRMIFK